MKTSLFAALALFAIVGATRAQMNGTGASADQGYTSGSSDSGKNGMSSSRTAPTSPTAGQPGTTDNGTPGRVKGEDAAGDRH